MFHRQIRQWLSTEPDRESSKGSTWAIPDVRGKWGIPPVVIPSSSLMIVTLMVDSVNETSEFAKQLVVIPPKP